MPGRRTVAIPAADRGGEAFDITAAVSQFVPPPRAVSWRSPAAHRGEATLRGLNCYSCCVTAANCGSPL